MAGEFQRECLSSLRRIASALEHMAHGYDAHGRSMGGRVQTDDPLSRLREIKELAAGIDDWSRARPTVLRETLEAIVAEAEIGLGERQPG